MATPRRILCAAILAAAVPAGAQTFAAGVVGVVRDSSGRPITSALVTAARIQTVSDTAGRFLLEGLAAGKVTLSIRRLGFEPAHLALDLLAGRRDSLVVTLVALPQVLPGVTADARRRHLLADFYRHRESGTGRFLDRGQITAMRVFALSDVLRRFPGVRISPDRSGRYLVRMGRSIRNCPPDFWIDNVRAPFLNVDDLPLTDIEAIEVYNGPSGLPPEYNNRFGNPACGAIVIWTRVPG